MNSRFRRCGIVGLLILVTLGLGIIGAEAQKPQTDESKSAESAPATEDKTSEAVVASETQPAASTQATTTKPAEEAKPQTIPLSFKKAPLDQVAKFLTDQMGKPVIVADKELEKIQVTLINPKPLPPDEALEILTTTLHEHGVAIEQRERTIHLIPIEKVSQSQITTVPPDVDVITIKPTNQIIRKIFNIQHYDLTNLVEVLKPLMPGYGLITSDPYTNKLIVVASVEQLIIMSRIIDELDKPDVSGQQLRVFNIEHVDVYEIIPTLEKLIATYLGVEVKAIVTTGGAKPEEQAGKRPSGPPGREMRAEGPSVKPGEEKPSGAITVKAEQKPVLIVPEPRRSRIVVTAAPKVLDQIEIWLKHLDQPKPPSTQTEIVEVQFSDAQEIANQLTTMLNNMPDESLRSAVRIFSFPTSRRLVIVGPEESRRIIKDWLFEIDVADSGRLITKTIILKHADAAQIAENIKELFEEQGRVSYWDRYSSRESASLQDKVMVTSNPRRNSVTIQATPEKMTRILEQIKEWDKPFEGEDAQPLIIDLKYADPEATKELLENLFTKKEKSSIPWWWDGEQESTPSPVGRLFGQFLFEAYPDTGKLIVISKNAENYQIIKDMVAQIDRPQDVGLPRIIKLKFADAEMLAEQLNALLNAPGTRAMILRRGRLGTFEGFSEFTSPYNTDGGQSNQPQQKQGEEDTSRTQMQFWWQEPPTDYKVKQPSNLVGKLRIVPNIEQNLLLVAAPEEYADAIEEFVTELDKPAYQVLVKAVIAEITHDDTMSLGFRFSTDPQAFVSGDQFITENALNGLINYSFVDDYGQQHQLTLNVDVNNLISLLGKKTNIKIKSEPKILTADNIEAEFFDGQDVPFISNSRITDISIGRNDTFDYFPVGIRLRVRPHITEQRNIDLTVNLIISSIVPGQTLFGGFIVDRRETTTRIVLEDRTTFMISGILKEEDRAVIRRIPGLGDIPLLGELFKHREMAKVNSELLVFLTPHVISADPNLPSIPREPVEKEPQKWFKQHWPEDEEQGVSDAQGPPVGQIKRSATKLSSAQSK